MRVCMRPFCKSEVTRACCVSNVSASFVRPCKQLVDARDVVRRFRQRARQLLNRRVAVELERIEAALDLGVVLMPVQNLRLGLGLELAQLLAQPRNRAAELAQVELDRVQLLAQSRLEDVDLAGAVQKRIEQSRVDARSFGTFGAALLRRRRRGRRDGRLAAAALRPRGGATTSSGLCSTIVASSGTSDGVDGDGLFDGRVLENLGCNAGIGGRDAASAS